MLAACLLATATTASAQFANGNTGSKKGSSATVVNTDPYGRFYVSYNPLTIKPDGSNSKNTTLSGVTVGFTKGISVSKSLPLFVEVGARFNFAFKSEDGYGMGGGYDYDYDYDYDDDDYPWYTNRPKSDYDYDYDYDDEDEDEGVKTKYTYMGVVIPVNLAYKWSSASVPVSITPFVGLTFKGNIVAKSKTEYDSEYYGDRKDEELDLFDKKDMKGKDHTWKRFQVGWQVGVGVDYKQLYVGFHYGSDFNEVCKKVNTSNWGVSLGLNF